MIATFYILIGISLLGILLAAFFAMYKLYKEEKFIYKISESKKRIAELKQHVSTRQEVVLRYKEQVFEIEDVVIIYNNNNNKKATTNNTLSNSEEGSFEYQY